MRKPTRFILFIAVAFTIIPCALYLFSYLFSEKDPVKIQQNAYRKFLKSLPEAVVNHFPREISRDRATNLPLDPARSRFFYYNPDFPGQGHFEQCEVWLKLDPTEIERLAREYNQPRTVVYQVQLQNRQYPWINTAVSADRSGENPPCFFTLFPSNSVASSSYEMPKQILPEDFMVFTNERINHMQGWVTGVAVSRRRNEALYFAKLSIAM